ncbi:MAG: BACON domain-containing protein [Odoribacteraceae bacterium]|jgi:hypothetical protein|nr:BACON domain-containing protein [Odoribacteraceae bacterium]
MKKALYLVPIVALLAACGTENNSGSYDEAILPVESANVASFPATGGTGSIVLATDETVTVTVDQPWCRTSVAGKTITVTVDTTPSILERTALVTLSAGERRAYIPVTQAPVLVSLDATSIAFSAKGGNDAITFKTPVHFTVASDQPWCRVSVDGEVITVTTELNENPERTANVTIRSGDRTRVIPVTQRAPNLEFATPVPMLDNDGNVIIKVYYDCILPITCVSNNDWISASITGDTLYMVVEATTEAMETSRPGSVTATSTNGLLTATITIGQRPLVCDIAPDPALDAVSAFMNLKNYNGTGSRYRVTGMSPTLQTAWDELADIFPTLTPAMTLRNFRVEAPRSSYKYSFIIHAVEGTTNKYYYWNSSNGFTTPDGGNSLHDVIGTVSGNSYSGMVSAQYSAFTATAPYTAFRGFFTSSTGMTIIPSGTAFYFRGIDDPTLWLKLEPTSW